MNLQPNPAAVVQPQFIQPRPADAVRREPPDMPGLCSAADDDDRLVARLVPDARRESLRIGVIGVACSGIPLAMEFARRHATVCFDIDADRIEALQHGQRQSCNVMARQLRSGRLVCSADPDALIGCDVLVIALQTPLDKNHRPGLAALREASSIAGRALQPGCLVIVETPLHSGVTEAICLPLLEQHSGLRLQRDFDLGCSSAQILAGRSPLRGAGTARITSASSPTAAARVERLYSSIASNCSFPIRSIRTSGLTNLGALSNGPRFAASMNSESTGDGQRTEHRLGRS